MCNPHRPFPVWIALLVTALFLGATGAPAHSDNNFTTIVLHAVEGTATVCDDDGGLDCVHTLPVVDIAGMQSPTVFVYVRNYESLTGLQCAFQWPAGWELLFGLWSCQPNQVNGTSPTTSGAHDGTLTTAFDAIEGGTLATVGMLIFSTAPDGCLDIIESDYPFQTHMVDAHAEVYAIHPCHRGRICVGAGGWDACLPDCPVVEAVSWGRIRQQFQ